MRTLSRQEFKNNLIEACADRDQYIPVNDLERFLDLNYDEDSSIAKWGYRDFADFATELAANLGDLSETCHEFDLKFTTKYKVKAFDIDYYITYEDINFDPYDTCFEDEETIAKNERLADEEIEDIKASLPTELIVEVECMGDCLDDEITDALSEETGWLINSFDYEIIEEN